VSPVAFLPDKGTITLTNPDGTPVLKDPSNPLRGNYTIPVPVERIVFPGGDASLITNLEYRFTIAGPVAIVPFVDLGVDPILRGSQLRINDGQLAVINSTVFGCPALDIALNCTGGHAQNPPFNGNLQIVQSTNWTPRMSTGLELQVFLPIVNAPFRVYWAYNALRLNETTRGPIPITRDMFPPGAAGDFTFQQAQQSLAPEFQLREPRKTFRFSVATTF
jgi:outer membrane protein insertion porin family